MRKLIALLLCSLIALPACAESLNKMAKRDISETFKIGIILKEENKFVKITGSGVAIGPHTILTARHVCVHGKPLKIFVKDSNGVAYPAYISKISFAYDLALLEVPNVHFKYAKLAKHMPKIGDKVYTTGYPLGVFLSYTEGIVNRVEDGMIVHQCPMTFGNSGGPLWDRHGRLVGINVEMLTLVPSWSGIGIAEGLDHIKDFLNTKTLLRIV